MWEKLLEGITQVITLGKEVERNSGDIKQLRKDFDELTRAVERLAYEVKRTQDNDRYEREKLVLYIENEMLKFERRLSSGDPKDKE